VLVVLVLLSAGPVLLPCGALVLVEVAGRISAGPASWKHAASAMRANGGIQRMPDPYTFASVGDRCMHRGAISCPRVPCHPDTPWSLRIDVLAAEAAQEVEGAAGLGGGGREHATHHRADDPDGGDVAAGQEQVWDG